MPEGWERAARGGSVVVGTRAAAWAPIRRLRAVVVAGRPRRGLPRGALADLVGRRRRGGAGPPGRGAGGAGQLRALPVALAEGRRVVTTSRSVERRGWPVVEVVDRTGDDPRTGLFSERLAAAAALGPGRPRRPCGVHPQPDRDGPGSLACAQCGALARCTRCGGAMAQTGVRRRPPVPAVRGAPPDGVCRVRRRAHEGPPHRGHPRHRGALGVDGRGGPRGLGLLGPARPIRAAAMRAWWWGPRRHCTEWHAPMSWPSSTSTSTCSRHGSGRASRHCRSWPGRPGWSASAAVEADLWSRPASPTTRCCRPRCTPTPSCCRRPNGACAGRSGSLRSEPWPRSAARVARPMRRPWGRCREISVSPDGDRWLLRAPDHLTLCDGLAGVARPAERLRVEVDPVDV